jgi:hypothetical protein
MSTYEKQNFVGEWKHWQQQCRKRKPVSTISISTRGRRCIKQRLVYDSGDFGKNNKILPGTTARPQDETDAIYLPLLYLTTNEISLGRNKEYIGTGMTLSKKRPCTEPHNCPGRLFSGS